MNSFMSTDTNDVAKLRSAVLSRAPPAAAAAQLATTPQQQTGSGDAVVGEQQQPQHPAPVQQQQQQQQQQSNLPEAIAIMDIVLRLLQLLCENHNPELQNYLRVQPNNKTSYNLVCQTLQFLDSICGSTTGGLGLLGLWINESNVHLINQALETLTEYCQGPCHENQYAIINHDSNGIDIVIALIINDIQPLSKNNMEMFLALKDNASKLLLAVMESNDDTSNAERIMFNVTPKALIDVIREAYEQGKEMDRQAEMVRVAATSPPPPPPPPPQPQHQQPLIDSVQQNNSEAQKETTTSTSTTSSQAADSSADASTTTTSAPAQHTCQRVVEETPEDVSSSQDNEALLSAAAAASGNDDANGVGGMPSSIPFLSTFLHESVEMEGAGSTRSGGGVDGDPSENGDDSSGAPPREVGHNLYILAHKLAKFNKELSILLKSKDSQENEALAYYAAHTAQIEVFIHNIIFYLCKDRYRKSWIITPWCFDPSPFLHHGVLEYSTRKGWSQRGDVVFSLHHLNIFILKEYSISEALFFQSR